MRRHEPTDEQWQVIQTLLPVSDAKGRPRVDDRLKQFRAIATRFDKTATSYRSMIDLATLLLWL